VFHLAHLSTRIYALSIKSVSVNGPVAAGEYRLGDESRGLTGDYRGQLAGQVADAVAESFYGAVPR
jgi:hypothetical protein